MKMQYDRVSEINDELDRLYEALDETEEADVRSLIIDMIQDLESELNDIAGVWTPQQSEYFDNGKEI